MGTFSCNRTGDDATAASGRTVLNVLRSSSMNDVEKNSYRRNRFVREM